jgi:hypothetical protein
MGKSAKGSHQGRFLFILVVLFASDGNLQSDGWIDEVRCEGLRSRNGAVHFVAALINRVS